MPLFLKLRKLSHTDYVEDDDDDDDGNIIVDLTIYLRCVEATSSKKKNPHERIKKRRGKKIYYGAIMRRKLARMVLYVRMYILMVWKGSKY